MLLSGSKLRDDGTRISDSPRPFLGTWWPGTTSFEEELLSDYGVDGPSPELERAFHDEVNAIQDSLAESQDEPADPHQRMMLSLNLRAKALGIWEEIAIPVRRQEGASLPHNCATRRNGFTHRSSHTR